MQEPDPSEQLLFEDLVPEKAYVQVKTLINSLRPDSISSFSIFTILAKIRVLRSLDQNEFLDMILLENSALHFQIKNVYSELHEVIASFFKDLLLNRQQYRARAVIFLESLEHQRSSASKKISLKRGQVEEPKASEQHKAFRIAQSNPRSPAWFSSQPAEQFLGLNSYERTRFLLRLINAEEDISKNPNLLTILKRYQGELNLECKPKEDYQDQRLLFNKRLVGLLIKKLNPEDGQDYQQALASCSTTLSTIYRYIYHYDKWDTNWTPVFYNQELQDGVVLEFPDIVQNISLSPSFDVRSCFLDLFGQIGTYAKPNSHFDAPGRNTDILIVVIISYLFVYGLSGQLSFKDFSDFIDRCCLKKAILTAEGLRNCHDFLRAHQAKYVEEVGIVQTKLDELAEHYLKYCRYMLGAEKYSFEGELKRTAVNTEDFYLDNLINLPPNVFERFIPVAVDTFPETEGPTQAAELAEAFKSCSARALKEPSRAALFLKLLAVNIDGYNFVGISDSAEFVLNIMGALKIASFAMLSTVESHNLFIGFIRNFILFLLDPKNEIDEKVKVAKCNNIVSCLFEYIAQIKNEAELLSNLCQALFPLSSSNSQYECSIYTQLISFIASVSESVDCQSRPRSITAPRP